MLYWRAPTASELAGTGLQLKHYRQPEVIAWPEAWPVIELYRDQLSTQWRAAGGGVIGLDYNVVNAELDRRGLLGHERAEFMDCLRVVELAAMNTLNRQ